MVKIPRTQIDSFFENVNKTQAIYLPVNQENGEADFKRWKKGLALSNALNTKRSAKDFFFPQTENLVEFKMEGKNIEVIDPRTEKEDFIIFGVRACDAKSFDILDRVFLVDPIDTYYKNRREHGTVITLCCNETAKTCFCSLFGINPAEPAGDVSAWNDDDAFYFEANTEKGKKFIELVSNFKETSEATKADSDSVNKIKEATKKLMQTQPFAKQNLSEFKEENLMKLFNDPAWAKLSQSCLGCGTCTFVCPTCQCYDIRDFDTGHGVKRFRCWDSCMYSDFTKMAAANPRLTQLERFRQRFMHKLVYYPAKNEGIYGCVGCGRCLNKCPISMNIVKVMKTLVGE